MSGYGEWDDTLEEDEMRDKKTAMLVWDPQLMHDIKEAMEDHRRFMWAFYLVWMTSLGWLVGSALA